MGQLMRIKDKEVGMKSWRIFEEREAKKLGGSQGMEPENI